MYGGYASPRRVYNSRSGRFFRQRGPLFTMLQTHWSSRRCRLLPSPGYFALSPLRTKCFSLAFDYQLPCIFRSRHKHHVLREVSPDLTAPKSKWRFLLFFFLPTLFLAFITQIYLYLCESLNNYFFPLSCKILKVDFLLLCI